MAWLRVTSFISHAMVAAWILFPASGGTALGELCFKDRRPQFGDGPAGLFPSRPGRRRPQIPFPLRTGGHPPAVRQTTGWRVVASFPARQRAGAPAVLFMV